MEQNINYQQELQNKQFDYPADVTMNDGKMELKWQQFQQREQQKLALLPNYYSDVSQSLIYQNNLLMYETPAEREERRRIRFRRCIFYIVFWTLVICVGAIQLSCNCVWQQQQTN